jgi:4-hydroxybenzoyl-CoA thioesterase
VTAPFVYVHRVRFDEIDAAGIAYFANFLRWCHDAMDALLASLDGGYASLVARRRLGLPTVHVDADFASPMRFGDEVHVALAVERLGTSSIALRFDLRRGDGHLAATLRHVVVVCDLDAMCAHPIPEDLRSLFERHLTP